MGSAKYHQFIERLAGFGFPVRFLREVESGYTIVPGPSSLVLPWFNVMLLEPAEFDSLHLMSAPRVGAATGIMNIYHETTHAWLDMNEKRADIATVVARGRAHYRGAPVEGGDAADADRLFQEAIASYVGRRAAAYWEAIEATQNLQHRLQKHQGRPEFQSADQRAHQQVPERYDSAMSERAFGFQARCSLCAQRQTSRLISGDMKRFADAALLENKIPDQFLSTGGLAKKWRGLRARP